MLDNIIHAKVIDSRGFEVRFIEFREDNEARTAHYMISVYSLDGGLIGDQRTAFRFANMGIKSELIDETYQTCSIGFCEREQKWYGWSHRAICGFGIGDVLQEGSVATTSGWNEEYIKEHPEADKSLPVGFTAHTLEDCRKIAIAFADAVT